MGWRKDLAAAGPAARVSRACRHPGAQQEQSPKRRAEKNHGGFIPFLVSKETNHLVK